MLGLEWASPACRPPEQMASPVGVDHTAMASSLSRPSVELLAADTVIVDLLPRGLLECGRQATPGDPQNR